MFSRIVKPKTGGLADPRRRTSTLTGGRRAGESDNPYLSARRTWNDHMREVTASRMMMAVFVVIALLIALGAIGGLVHVAEQSKFIPYVVEVDKLGQTLAVNRADSVSAYDDRIIRASLAAFITDARTVTPDVSLQRKFIFTLYGMISQSDPAFIKMNEYLNGNEKSTPFARAETELVDVQIRNVLPLTQDSWQVDWQETTRERSGAVKKTVDYRATLSLYIKPPGANISETEIHLNPIGLYIKDFSWAPLQ